MDGELTKSRYCTKKVAAGWQVEIFVERPMIEQPPWRKQPRREDSYSAVDVRLVPSDDVGSGQTLNFFKKHRLQMIDASGKVTYEI